MFKRFKSYFFELLPGGLIALKKSAVIRNAGALYIIQFAELIIPLITIPYILKILGPSLFGIASYCTSLIAYFSLFVDYGFNMSATRGISVRREDGEYVNKIFTTTLVTKSLFFLIGMLVLFLLVMSVSKISQYGSLMFVAYLAVLGNILSNQYVFQGLERMEFLAVSNLVSKVIMLIAIFVVLPSSHNSVFTYLIILSVTQIINGVIGFIYSVSFFNLKLVQIKFGDVIFAVRDGWSLFLSTASLSLYMIGNPFILGLFTSSNVVGYYSGAEKIVRSISGVVWPVTQAIYPKFTKIAGESKETLILLAKKFLIIMGSFGALLSIATFVFSELLVNILLGRNFEPSIMLIRIMSPLPFLIAISNVLGVQILLPLGKDKQYVAVLFIAGMISLGVVVLFASRFGAFASAIALLSAELSVTIGMGYIVKTKIGLVK